MIHSRARILYALLGILVLALIISVYFAIHKPIGNDQARQIGVSSGQVLIAFLLLSLCGGVGGKIQPESGRPPLVLLALQGALGLGVVGAGILLIGVVFGFATVTLVVTLGAAYLFFARSVLRWWRLWRKAFRSILDGGKFEKAAAVLTGLIFLFSLIQAFAPPLKYDALVYHLTLPNAYIEAGRFVYTPWLMFWGMPQTMEMLFTAALALGGTATAAIFGWWVGLTAFLGVLGFTKANLGLRSGWVGGLTILSGFTLASSLAWGYVEWATILMGIAFIIAIANWMKCLDRRNLITAGIVAGFAIGVKYTAGILFLAGVMILIWQIVRRQAHGWKPIVIYTIATGLAALPWLLKNIWATGNPIYPFLFPAGSMDVTRLEHFQGLPVWGDLLSVILLPVQATILGAEGKVGFGASIGPLFLGLGLLCWVGWRRRDQGERSTIELAGLIVACGLLVWALASRLSGYLIQTRLYLPVFPAAAMLAASGFLGLSRMKARGIRPGRIAAVLILLVVFLNVVEIVTSTLKGGALDYLLGVETRETFLENNLDWYFPAAQSIAHLPAGSRTLMLWEARSFYCVPACLPDEVIDRWKRDIDRLHDPQSVRADWVSEGFTHLLLYRTGMEFVKNEDGRYQEGDWTALTDLIDSLSLIKDFGGIYQLYALNR